MSDATTRNDHDDYRTRLRRVLRTRCAYLSTKEAVMPLPDPGDLENPYDTAVWWCARTTEALGPDGSAARPGACDGPGRACYRPPGGAAPPTA